MIHCAVVLSLRKQPIAFQEILVQQYVRKCEYYEIGIALKEGTKVIRVACHMIRYEETAICTRMTPTAGRPSFYEVATMRCDTSGKVLQCTTRQQPLVQPTSQYPRVNWHSCWTVEVLKISVIHSLTSTYNTVKHFCGLWIVARRIYRRLGRVSVKFPDIPKRPQKSRRRNFYSSKGWYSEYCIESV